MNMKSSKGISLISLIITIIVIIILAAIVIFSGMGTPEKAQLSAVISDIDNVQTAVDQAYYGFYTEKSVAGEVWTKSQFYEAVATGETNRDNLSGTGIVPISKDGMVKMTLPNYEGRSWGVAVEDIDDTTKVGSVVLYPGYETDGKIYSTLLDVQNDGRISQLADGIKASIEVSNIRITIDSAGTVDAGTDVTDGTTLYINFDASEDGTPVTISPSLPFAVTTNGDYEFTLTNASEKTKKYVVKVNNYKVATVANTLEIGDYVYYEADASNSYTLNSELTGYEAENGKVLKPEKVRWRVWDKKEDGSVVIVINTVSLNKFTLSGAKGFVNSVEVIEAVCDLYTNTELGITTNDVRSLKLEDIEDPRVSSNMISIRDNYYKGQKYFPQYGETNAEKYGNSGYTSGTFYTESDGITIRKTPIIASETNPVVMKQTFYNPGNGTTQLVWNNLENSKFNSDTYGTLLRASSSSNASAWIASPRVDLGKTGANFNVPYNMMSYITTDGLYHSSGLSRISSYGVKPLVTLPATLRIDTSEATRDGSSSAKAWKLIKK